MEWLSIQWFPGHMAKARRQVEEKLKLVDIVFELLDARLPLSSQNPMITAIMGKKPRLVLLTKSDLADPKINQQWLEYFANHKLPVLAIDAQSGKGVKKIYAAAEKSLQVLFASREKKGIQSKRVRAMIIGIPNVGKSSLINRLAGRSATQTGNRPGVTKSQQWIRIGKTMELLDTPGILWPKFDQPEVGFRLAASGAIKETILPTADVALELIQFLLERYPKELQQRYKLTSLENEALPCFEQIAQKRGCLQKGGILDMEKAAEIILHDFRLGRIGRISLETPADWVGRE